MPIQVTWDKELPNNLDCVLLRVRVAAQELASRNSERLWRCFPVLPSGRCSAEIRQRRALTPHPPPHLPLPPTRPWRLDKPPPVPQAPRMCRDVPQLCVLREKVCLGSQHYYYAGRGNLRRSSGPGCLIHRSPLKAGTRGTPNGPVVQPAIPTSSLSSCSTATGQQPVVHLHTP